MEHYLKKSQEKGLDWCRCHPRKMYDPKKFVGCYECFQANFDCCQARKNTSDKMKDNETN